MRKKEKEKEEEEEEKRKGVLTPRGANLVEHNALDQLRLLELGADLAVDLYLNKRGDKSEGTRAKKRRREKNQERGSARAAPSFRPKGAHLNELKVDVLCLKVGDGEHGVHGHLRKLAVAAVDAAKERQKGGMRGSKATRPHTAGPEPWAFSRTSWS